MTPFRTMHLFAGAGGGLYADLLLGHQPIVAVELDEYRCQVLRERAEEGWFPGLEVWEGDVREFPAAEWQGRVDCIHAGFPCQPHSIVGFRKGAEDDRNLWPATRDIIQAVRPQFVFLENVPGILSNRFIATVLSEMAEDGYDAKWTVLGVDEVGATHKRERWWCLACSNSAVADGNGKPLERWGVAEFVYGPENPVWSRYTVDREVQTLGDACRAGQQNNRVPLFPPAPDDLASWRNVLERHPELAPVIPCVRRVAYGVAPRCKRLAALGDGQVPLAAAAAWILLGGPLWQ